MPNTIISTNKTRKVPINTNNLFYSDESLAFETEIGMNYLTQDCNMTCVYYAVDLEKTNIDTNYGETNRNNLIFKTPKEIHCLYNLNAPELRSYEKSKNLGSYVKAGKLEVYVFQNELDEQGIETRIGDYIAIQVTQTHKEVFTIVDDGRNNYSNEMSIYGYPSTWKKIICSPVSDASEFEGNK